MKPEHELPERPLIGLLHEWRIDTPLPARFNAQVWQRIARAETVGGEGVWRALWGWLTQGAMSPGWTLGCVAGLLLAGGASGYWEGSAKSKQELQAQRLRYVQAVDPYFRSSTP